MRPCRESVGVMKQRSGMVSGFLQEKGTRREKCEHTLPSHQNPPLGQFFRNPLPIHQVLGHFLICQVLERVQFTPICTVDLRVGLEILRLEGMGVEVDDLPFQKCDDVRVLGRRSLVGNVICFHRTRQGHIIVIDIMDSNLDGPILVPAIPKTVNVVGQVSTAVGGKHANPAVIIVATIDYHRVITRRLGRTGCALREESARTGGGCFL